MIVPTAVDWSASHYPPAERPRPVALVNTSYHLAGIIGTQFVGAALPFLGWPGVLAVLALVVAVALVVVGMASLREAVAPIAPNRRR